MREKQRSVVTFAWDSDRERNKISFKTWSSHASQLRLDYKENKLDGGKMIRALERSTKCYNNKS